MTGLPAGFSVQFSLGGVWVDATPWVIGESDGQAPPPSWHVGRPNEFSDVDVSTLTFGLRNEDGRWTPRVASSPYSPYLVPGVQVQVSVTHNSVTYPAWGGKVVTWSPSWPGFSVANGVVTVTCSCYLQDMTNIALEDRWTEDARATARAQSTWADIPDLSGQSTAVTTIVNIGVPGTGALGAVTISGSPTFGSPAGSNGVQLGKSVSGPATVVVSLQGTPGTIDVWVQIPTTPLSSVVGTSAPIMILYQSGTPLMSLWLYVDSGPTTDMVVSSGSTPSAWLALITRSVNTGEWWHLSLTPTVGTPTSTTVTAWSAGTGTHAVTAAQDMRPTTSCSYGSGTGGMAWSGFVATGGTQALNQSTALMGQTALASATFAALMSYCPSVPASNYRGLEVLTIGEPTWVGQSALLVLQQIARTIGGIGWCRPDGTVELVAGDVAYAVVSAATLDVVQDIDAATTAPTFIDSSTEQPTRVTVTFPGGQVQVLNMAAESAGKPRREKDLLTCATSSTIATTIGNYQLADNNALRIGQFTVDMYTSIQDLWAVLLSLYPTAQLGTSGWATAMFGSSTYALTVQGWTVTASEDSWLITFDGSPAGLFAAGAFDAGDAYGRWDLDAAATVTGGTAVGTTGTGTIVVTTSATPLSTASGDYPLTLLWESEAVVIPSPPGSSTSPQTLTIGTRGADGTTAVTHTTSSPILVWDAAFWGGLI